MGVQKVGAHARMLRRDILFENLDPEHDQPVIF